MHHENMVYFDEMNTQPYDQQEDIAGLKLDRMAYLCFCKTHDLIYSPFMVNYSHFTLMCILGVFSREFSILHPNHIWTLAAYFYSKPAKVLLCVKMF